MNVKLSLLATSVALALVGCGGSDSGSDSSSDSKPAVDGIVITGFDGYFKHAVVFEDVNGNGDLNPAVDTIFGLTNAQGKITLPKSTTITHDLALKTLVPGEMSKELAIKLAAASPAIDTYSDFMDIYTTDMDHEGQPIANSVVFRAPTNGSIDNAVISPLTDLVAIEMQKSGVDIEAATATVSANLGVTDEQPVDLFSDFVKDSSTNLASAKLHKTAQILTESKAKNPADYATNATTITETAADTSETLVTEENMGSDELLNTKPVIDPSAPSIVITNIKLLINNAAKAEVTKQFAELNLQENTAATRDIILPENLFVDNFAGVQTNVPVEKAAINGSGITVKLEAGLLKIDTTGLQLSQEQFIVTLTASDRKEVDGTALNELSVAFVIDIELSNTAPTVSDEYQTSLENEINNWELKQGVQFSQQLDVMGLFDDREGDLLTYATDIAAVIPGLTSKYDQKAGKVTISGRPLTAHIAGKQFTITANDGHVQTRIASQPAGFTLPAIAEGTISSVPGMTEKMQEVANSWELQVAEEFHQTLEANELFTSDISGDESYYAHYAANGNESSANSIPGVTVTVDQSGLVTLKGKPTAETNGVILYISKGINFSGGKENDIESEMVQIRLPDVQPAKQGSIETNRDTHKQLIDTAADWALELQVGKAFHKTLDISSLFIGDFDGTVEYYANYAEHDHNAAENPISGVNVEVDAAGMVTLSGTPTKTTDSVKLYVAKGFNIFGGKDNDIESETVVIPLPNVQPGEDVTPPPPAEFGFTKHHFNNQVAKMGSFARGDGEIAYAMLSSQNGNLAMCWGNTDHADISYKSNISIEGENFNATRPSSDIIPVLEDLDNSMGYEQSIEKDCWEVTLNNGYMIDAEGYQWEMLYQNVIGTGVTAQYQIIMKTGDELFWFDSSDTPFAEVNSVSTKVVSGTIEYQLMEDTWSTSDFNEYSVNQYTFSDDTYRLSSVLPSFGDWFLEDTWSTITDSEERELIKIIENDCEDNICENKTRQRYIHRDFGDFYINIEWDRREGSLQDGIQYMLFSTNKELMTELGGKLPIIQD